LNKSNFTKVSGTSRICLMAMTTSTEVPSEKQNPHSSSYMLNAETPYTPIFVRPISTLFISLPNSALVWICAPRR